MMPTTQEVLQAVSSVGIVVGSAVTAADPTACKDVDVVVPEAGFPHPLLQTVYRRWEDYCTSVITDHLVVYARPVNVELFVNKMGTLCKDPHKTKAVRAYSTLKKRCRKQVLFGVEVNAYRP